MGISVVVVCSGVGYSVGPAVGAIVGNNEGLSVGSRVGPALGMDVTGLSVGAGVSAVHMSGMSSQNADKQQY